MDRYLRRCSLLSPWFCAFAAAQVVEVDLTSLATTVDLGPGYSAEPAWTYDSTLPGRLIRVTEGQTLRVRYKNELDQSSIVHWHGQAVPLPMDGMGGISRPEVATGQELRYELTDLRSGTYFYHPNSQKHPEQVDRGLYGVLIVDPANPAADPVFDVEAIVVLDDWLEPFGSSYRGHLINGRTSAGQQPIVVQTGDRLRLRVINAAARTNYVFALENHSMIVTHSDGHRVQPVLTSAVPIGIGERYDVIIHCSNPGVWSLAVSTIEDRNTIAVRGEVRYVAQHGPSPSPSVVPSTLSSGWLMSYAQLASFQPSAIAAQPNLIMPVVLDEGSVAGQPQFTINGQAWPAVALALLVPWDIVQLELSSAIRPNAPYYPMYLHGHRFRLLGTAGGATRAPSKDSLLVYPAGRSFSAPSLQFTGDNPGRWLLRSQHLDQLQAGLMGTLDYVADSDGDSISDARDLQPELQAPVVTISEDGAAYLPGATDVIALQWQPGQQCTLMLSLYERDPPLLMPPYGSLSLLAAVLFGQGIVGINGRLPFPYALPNDPILSGLAIHLQGVCDTHLLGEARLGTMQTFWVR